LASALRWMSRCRAAEFANAVLEDVDAAFFATGFFAAGSLATDLFVVLAMAVLARIDRAASCRRLALRTRDCAGIGSAAGRRAPRGAETHNPAVFAAAHAP
jgi:hypothetical protein